ncbi:MAG: phage portal protein, partial [Lachnospiraceae bacterium]|nr:phage portal protein [Lachnospiraceae bacterium]
QGIRSAIKNSSIVRWLLKYTTAQRDEDLKMRAKEFADNYLNISNNSVGVAAVDAKADAIQVNNTEYVPNAAQIDKQTERIYAFFQTNDKIVHSNFSENDWIAYYEAAIEPIIKQMSGEYTRKLFTRRERGCGNKIIFDSSGLTYASMATKLSLVQFVDRRIMTPNEVREVFAMAPLPGGDEPLLRKDTEVMKGGE